MNSTQRIKLAFLVPHSGMSGAEINIRYLLDALPKTEFDVHLIAPPDQPLLQTASDLGWTPCPKSFPQFASTSIEIATLRIFNPLAVLYDLWLVLGVSLWLSGYVRRNRIQIVYTGAMMTHLIGIFLSLMQPELRLIVHMQTIISPRLAGGLGRRLFSRFAGRATRIVAVSQAVADAFPASDRVALIYNAADVAAYESIQASTFRDEIGIAPAEPLIGVIGRLTPWKGHRVFLDAAQKLVQAGIPGHFVIVGDDIDPAIGKSQYRPVLEAYTKTLCIQDRVIFTGLRKDIPNVMRALDMLVIPSLRPDPSPLVVLEGMASGIPVIGSNAGGVAEVILDGKTGRLFPPGDSAALAAILQDLIAQPTLRAQYGNAARQRVKDHFTLERYTSALTDLFRQVSGV